MQRAKVSGRNRAVLGRNVLRPYKVKSYERKRTDSRWNIFTARNRATAA